MVRFAATSIATSYVIIYKDSWFKMQPQSRFGDQSLVPADSHGCKKCPHTAKGPATTGSPDVWVNGLPALRVGDTGTHSSCCGPNTWIATKGSRAVLINGMQAHRLLDEDQHCGGKGFMLEASENVFVGECTETGLGLAQQFGQGLVPVPEQAQVVALPMDQVSVVVDPAPAGLTIME